MRLVISTAPPDRAPDLARGLVEERLAACVSIVPNARSIYVWEGRLCDESEAVMIAKTTDRLAGALSARLREIHPYDVPEIACVEVSEDEGNPDYFAWVHGLDENR